MTLRRLALLAFLPALFAVLPLAGVLAMPRPQAANEAPLTIEVTLEAGPLAAARIWRFEVLDAAGAVVDTVELSLSGDASHALRQSRALPFGEYTVRQVLGNDMDVACGPGVFYANAAPVRSVQIGATGGSAHFTITVCPDASEPVGVDRPVDGVTDEPTETVDEVRGTRVAGNQSPEAPAVGTGVAPGSPGSKTPLFAAVALLLFALPLALAAARRP